MPQGTPNRIARLEHLKQADRRRGQSGFRLRSLFVVITLMSIAFAAFVAFGGPIWHRVLHRIEMTSHWIPEAPLMETMLPFSVLLNVVGGLVTALVVYLLRGRKGFIVFGALCVLGLIGLLSSLALDVAPLAQTPTRDATVSQILFMLIVIGSCLLPVSAFTGWYASYLLGRNVS